jgi:hypothetical protein
MMNMDWAKMKKINNHSFFLNILKICDGMELNLHCLARTCVIECVME